METRASYVSVGIFVMACLAALIVATLWLTGLQYRQEFAHYITYFNGAVTGLGRGTVVRYNGIEAGHVTDLTFDQTDPKRVFVTLEMDPTLKLHVDSVASMESQGITGGTYVEITGGTATSPLLKPEPGQNYPVIPSKASTLEQLAESGSELVGHFNVVGERLSDVLNDDNRKALSDILLSLRNLTAALDKHSGDIDATLANLKDVTAGMNKTLQNVDHTLGSMDQTLTSADRTFDSVKTAAGSLNGALISADATVQKLGKLTEDTDKVVNGQSVAQMTQLVGQTRALVAALTRLTNDVERQPTKLIYGDQREGYTPR